MLYSAAVGCGRVKCRQISVTAIGGGDGHVIRLSSIAAAVIQLDSRHQVGRRHGVLIRFCHEQGFAP
jgi:hypothetical protein